MPERTSKARPKLVNRGAPGLLKSLSEKDRKALKAPKVKVKDWKVEGKKNNIARDLLPFAVPIDSVKPDPRNARLHPERNIEAIQESLAAFGQVKPLVVRKETGTVMAGNGTLEAAKGLGWTKLAALRVSMTDAEAAGYGLADNQTALLGKWDFEVIAALDKIVREAGLPMAGWSADELEVLRGNVEFFVPQDEDPEGKAQTWQELWQGMPVFDQEDKTAAFRVVVNFKTEEDLEDFMKKINQPRSAITNKSLWHPPVPIERYSDKKFVSKRANGRKDGKGGRKS
jgi:hypothetical protein